MVDPNLKSSKIGKYLIQQKLNEGVSSIIYLVNFNNQQFALKQFKSNDKGSQISFRRESSALARLNHPNLVKIFDAEEFEDRRILVMEYLQGKNIEEIISSKGHLSVEASIEIALSVCFALTELHKNNVVHRDIKPANIFKTVDGSIQLIDLGLVGDIEQIKLEISLVGTPTFCSPEQSRILKREVDFRSDLYSLGATLFCMLTGRTPFVGSMSEVLQYSASQKAPDIRDFVNDIPVAVAAIIAKLLSKDPDDRYQSVQGLIYDLSNYKSLMKVNLESELKIGSKDKKSVGNKVDFVDRNDDIQRLLHHYENAKSGRCGICIIKSPSGLGKTRLSNEFIQSLENKRGLVIRAQCQDELKEFPLSAIRESVDFLFEEISQLSETDRGAELQKLSNAALGLEHELIKLNPKFEKFLNFKKVMLDESNRLEEQADFFYQQIADFFIKLSQLNSSLIFQLEDFQWIDPGSAEVFQKILDSVKEKKIFVLATSRDGSESRFETIITQHLLEELVLLPFNENQLAKLINSFLGSRGVNEEIVKIISDLSRGNILVAIEYLRAGLENGYLYFKANSWHINKESFGNLSVSNIVSEIIFKKIENCSSKIKNFLQAAALTGNSFNPYEIAAVLNTELEEMEQILSSSENLSLIEKINGQKWRFTNAKVSEYLLASLNKNEFAVVSDLLANFYFSKNEKSADEIYFIPRLFANSNIPKNRQKLLQSQIDAGQFALSLFSYNEAYTFFKFAFDQFDGSEFDQNLRKKYVRELAFVSTILRDEKVALEAIQLHISNQTDVGEQIKALSIKAWALANLSDFVGGSETIKFVLAKLGKPFPNYFHWKMVNILWTWALITFWEFIPFRIPFKFLFSSKNNSLYDIFEVLKIAQSCFYHRRSYFDSALVSLKMQHWALLAGSSREKAIGYASVAQLYGTFGLRSLAQYYVRKSEEHSAIVKDPAIEAYVQTQRIIGLFYAGALKNAEQEHNDKIKAINTYLPPLESGRFRAQIAMFAGAAGSHENAIRLLKESINGYQNRSLRMSRAQHAGQIGNLHAQLAMVGRTKETQSLKDYLQKENLALRYNPLIFNISLQTELSLQRCTEEVDHTTDEMIASISKRINIGPLDPITSNYTVNITYLRFFQFEKSNDIHEKFSRRRALTEGIRRHAFALYAPLFRSNYYTVLGTYCRSIGLYRFAERYLNKAEKLADESNNYISLFDIQRSRAHIHIDTGRTELAQLCATTAFNMAQRKDWDVRKGLVLKEFKNILVSPEQYSFDATHTTTHSTVQEGMTFSGSTRNYGTVNTNDSIVNKSVIGNVSQIGAIPIEDMRFVDAILNVSKAFAVSIEPIEQARAVLKELIKLFASERGLLFEINPKTQVLNSIGVMDGQGQLLPFESNYSRVLVEKVLETKNSLVISSTEQAVEQGCDVAQLFGIRSMMIAPLLFKESIVGVIYLDSTLTRRLFTESDATLFMTLANQISVAIELSKMKEVEAEKSKLKTELSIQSAILSESKKVKILIDSMQQGLFSVISDGTIVEPISNYTKKILGADVVGKNFIEVIYQQLATKTEKVDAIKSAMFTVFGEDELQWDLMSENFPSKIGYVTPSKDGSISDEKILRIKPSAVWDKDENLEKILFVVDDITNLEALENQVKQHKTQSILLSDILHTNKEDLGIFLTEGRNTVATWTSSIQDFSEAIKASIMRSMHTLKGVARLYKLSHLSEQIHHAETKLAAVQASATFDAQLEMQIAVEEIQKISSVIQDYNTLFKKIYLVHGSNNSSGTMNEEAFIKLESAIEEISLLIPPQQLNQIKWATRRLQFKSLSSSVRRYENMIQDICAQLNKKASFIIDGEAFATDERLKTLNECFIHLIRNSIDHGLEDPVHRLNIGKPEEGTIRIEFSETSSTTTIKISDDGRGIDPAAMAQIAVRKGIITETEANSYTEEQKLDLIFRTGFTSKVQATDVSGRGIGMDVVKTNIQLLGGQIQITTDVGKGTVFIIKLDETEHAIAS